MNKTDFCLCGFSCAVKLLFVDEYPVAGKGAIVQGIITIPGADAFIIASLLSENQKNALLITNDIGLDEDGSFLFSFAVKKCINTTFKQNDKLQTPKIWSICDSNKQRTWFVYNNFAEPPFHELANNEISSNTIIYLDLYSSKWISILHVIEKLKHNRFLINIGESEYNEKLSLLSKANGHLYIQASVDSGMDDEIVKLLKLPSDFQNIKASFVTMGERGCVCSDEKKCYSYKANKIDALHTFGAGAAFSYGLLVGIYHNFSVDRMCNDAVKYAEEYMIQQKTKILEYNQQFSMNMKEGIFKL